MNEQLEIVQLDVSELLAPEPMRQILLRLTTLKSSQCLQVIHRKEPLPLYKKIEDLGFNYETKKDVPTNDFYSIYITYSNNY